MKSKNPMLRNNDTKVQPKRMHSIRFYLHNIFLKKASYSMVFDNKANESSLGRAMTQREHKGTTGKFMFSFRIWVTVS